jgi:hypothetical protein
VITEIKGHDLGEAWKLDAYLKKEKSQDAKSCSVGIKPHVLKGTKEGHADPNLDINCNGLSVIVLKKAVFDFLDARCYLKHYSN